MNYKEVDSLVGTVDLMLSDNWKDRLVAEYLQAKIRKEKLSCYLEKVNGKFTSKPPNRHLLREWEVLEREHRALKEYLLILELRLKELNIHVETNGTDN